MKALSIRQPWAWLIVHGYKDVENRTWSTKFRGRVQVHAGKFPDPGWFPQLAREVEARGIALPDQPSLGGLVGEGHCAVVVGDDDSELSRLQCSCQLRSLSLGMGGGAFQRLQRFV